MAAPDPYARSVFHGKTLDNATIAALKVAEKRLGYELTITQGGFNAGGVTASAGTHDLGRVVDLAAWDWKNKLTVLKNLGFAAWYRPFRPGLWGAHIHAVLIFPNRTEQKGVAGSAWRQIKPYDLVLDGLASGARDVLHPFRPDPKERWSLAEYERQFAEPVFEPTATQLVRNGLVEAIHDLGETLALMENVRENRTRVHAEQEPIVAARNALKASLARMPLR